MDCTRSYLFANFAMQLISIPGNPLGIARLLYLCHKCALRVKLHGLAG